ncbi:Uncharacterized protein GNX_2754 [Leptospira interrogans serovar Canicola]|nr:Uncharacterized protein GNX_2754 [Leptospira interrogans serovar Canicola]
MKSWRRVNRRKFSLLHPIISFLNEGAVGLSATARCILDELRDWHKKTEKHGSKSIHPSYLLTLDKLSDLLNKYRNLSEQAKSPPSIDLALRQLVDYEKKGKNKVCLYLSFFSFVMVRRFRLELRSQVLKKKLKQM